MQSSETKKRVTHTHSVKVKATYRDTSQLESATAPLSKTIHHLLGRSNLTPKHAVTVESDAARSEAAVAHTEEIRPRDERFAWMKVSRFERNGRQVQIR